MENAIADSLGAMMDAPCHIGIEWFAREETVNDGLLVRVDFRIDGDAFCCDHNSHCPKRSGAGQRKSAQALAAALRCAGIATTHDYSRWPHTGTSLVAELAFPCPPPEVTGRVDFDQKSPCF